MTIHLVYPDGPVLTAACGQEIRGYENGHTGRYANAFHLSLLLSADNEPCQACVHLLETP